MYLKFVKKPTWLLGIIIYLFSVNSYAQQINFPERYHSMDSLLYKYHFLVHQISVHNKCSNEKTIRIDIGDEIKGNLKGGVGDFLLAVDDEGTILDVRVLSIEIQNIHGRFYDWVIFDAHIGEENMEKIGASLEEIHQYKLNARTENVVRAMIENIKTCIELPQSPSFKSRRYLYKFFSF